MRKDMALNRYTSGMEDAIFGAFKRLAGMSHQVRIPWLHPTAVEKDAKAGRMTFEETMKGHRKMRFDTIGKLDHVVGSEAIGHDAVELLPEHHGAVRHLRQRRKQML